MESFTGRDAEILAQRPLYVQRRFVFMLKA